MSRKFFIKIVTDPDVDLRKCVVGVACAAQAINDGHDVDVFFAADGVKMIHADYVRGINEQGNFPDGMIFNMLKVITAKGASKVYCSTGSQAANGVTKENADEVLLEGYSDWMTWSANQTSVYEFVVWCHATIYLDYETQTPFIGCD